MRRGVPFAIVLAVALAVAGHAIAGGAPDPRPGDKLLGKTGGLAYVSDAERATNPGFTQALTSCPGAGGKWRITGGGIRIANNPALSTVSSSRPLDILFGDDDAISDDYWEASAAAPVDTPITSYAICAKLEGLEYRSVTTPDQPTEERTATDRCPAGTKVTGGGGFIATTGSRMTSMHPTGKRKWSIGAYDTIGGFGATTSDFVCLKSKHLTTVVEKRTIPEGLAETQTATCPKGSHVTGGGARISKGPAVGLLNSSYPLDGNDKDKAPDDAWTAIGHNEAVGPLKLSVYAICMD
jgi:hypothetical protein